MPIFRRKPAPPATAPPSGLRCQAQGCSSTDAMACSYRDRRGRGCRAVFCADHTVLVDDVAYCRRHGGTMRALGAKARVRAGLPDIDNRGPSLVQHVGSALDEGIRTRLRVAALPTEQVIADADVTKAFNADRSSRWERSWRLVDDTGVVAKITLFVTEEAPDTLAVRLGSRIAFRDVPPWISRRARGERLSEMQDEEARRQFYAELEATIATEIASARETSEHPAWAG
ncbi:MAG TPA: hypothetical protein VF155_07950 [Candidatus Dormibacteraeota bacterium]